LYAALLDRGHDVSCTPATWIRHDASDLEQVLAATAQGRCIYTMNTKDFLGIGEQYKEHHGIILASQRHWTLTTQINALDRLLRETDADDWLGQIRWLNQWR
jgi:hypothetical protein